MYGLPPLPQVANQLPQVALGWPVAHGRLLEGVPGAPAMTPPQLLPNMTPAAMMPGTAPGAMAAFAQAGEPPKAVAHLPPQPQARSASTGAVDVTEVAAALETLYVDRLRPYGRILRKRLGERAQAAGLRSVDVDIKRLRTSCEACPWLVVREEEGGDWSALFRGRPEPFVDVYSPQDLYPADLWRAAATYFASLDDSSMVLPGGRYLCAQVLAKRCLPFLAGRTLGEVCHIVQLAISQKKLLGYLNGAVVPYQRSQSMVKERCAERQRPCTSTSQGKSALASWQSVRRCLEEILKEVPVGTGSVPLSNVKRLFRSRFHIELSETALGHAKLSELLQDPRISDVCTVRLQGQGYVVAPRAHETQWRSQISLADSIDGEQPGPAEVSEGSQNCVQSQPVPNCSSFRERAKWIQPLSLEEEEVERDAVADLRAAMRPLSCGSLRTPLGLPVSTPSPTSVRLGALAAGLHREVSVPALGLSTPASPSPSAAAKEGPNNLSPGSLRKAQSLPRLLGRPGPAPQANPAASADISKAPVLTTKRGETGAKECAPQASSSGGKHFMTPFTLGHMGFSVQNTFIHVTLPPPTPPAGASCRAHSLPRNMGSSGRHDSLETSAA